MQSAGHEASYTYDANGLRTSKTVNNITKNHVWDGMNMVKDGDTVYNYGLDLISSSVGDYYIHDGHGGVIALANNEGTITPDYKYDAFGTQYIPMVDDSNPFRYCGEYYDKESDLIYLRARYYDPSDGRFLTQDPVKDGLNWYVYCYSNPVAYVDPSGLTTLLDIYKYANENPDIAAEVYNKDPSNYLSNMEQLCRPQTPVNIIENEDSIVIYSYVNVSGDAANIPFSGSTYTYRDGVLQGIEKAWSGSYNGKKVISLAIETTTGPYVEIEVYNQYGVSNVSNWNSLKDPGKMTMYIGDHRNKPPMYNYTSFYMTVGHEMGHIFGVADLYNDNLVANKFNSIMNSQFNVSGAQPVDFAMMFKAQKTNQWQIWHDNRNMLREKFGIFI